MNARRHCLLPLLALCLGIAQLSAALAQDIKPVAVVSIASVERNLADIVYLSRIVNQEDTGKTAMLFGNALTAGMDKTRPAGLFVVPQGTDFYAVAFLPVTDLKLLLEVHKEQVGEPKDVGGSILEIGTDQKAFVKEQNGWAFLAEKQEQLATLPIDPGQLLGDLPTKYNLAARVLVQNIPAELKKMAIEQMKAGMESALPVPGAPGAPGQPAPGAPGQPAPGLPGQPNAAQLEELKKTYLAQMDRLINESEEITVGLLVDSAGKRVCLDVMLTAREGTDLAARMARQEGLKSQFTGFKLPEAAVTATYTFQAAPEDAAQAQAAMKQQFAQLTQVLDAEASVPPEKKEALKKLLGELFRLAEQSLATGKTDGGAVVVLQPGSFAIVTGGFFADGAGLEKLLKDFAELMKDQPATTVPQIQFNTGVHGETKLHRGTMLIDAANPARNVFGEKIDLAMATGKSTVLVGIGKDSEALIKKVLDQSASGGSEAVLPLEVNISLLPILKYAQSFTQGNPILTGAINTLETEGNDKVIVLNTPGARSNTTRVELQEGVVRAVGDVVQTLAAQFGGQFQQ